MTKSDHSFESYFNRLPHQAKVRLANRRIEKLDADLMWCDAFGVTHERVKDDDWFVYDPDMIRSTRDRWVDVRDRLVWDGEEVVI